MAKAFPNTGATVGLAADRTAMTGMYAGQQFFETDTNLMFVYNGSAWVGGSPITSLLAQSTTTQTGAANSDFTYATAEITLTPGTWLVSAGATMTNTVVDDGTSVALWNQTLGVEIANSTGPAGSTGTAYLTSLVARDTVISVTTNTIIRVRCKRNGASTIRARSEAGAPAAYLNAVRLQY